MANLPKTIQAQVDAADAFLEQSRTPQGSPDNQGDAAAPEPESPAADDHAPVAHTADTTPAPQAQTQQVDVWEARYKTLQGLFNQQVPELQRQVKDLTTRYQEAVAHLEKAAKPQEQVQQKPQVDPKDIDNFGADLVEMVQRVTASTLGGVVAKVDGLMNGVQQRLAVLERELQGTSQTLAHTAQESFMNQLDKAVPDWRKVNEDQRFLAWLGEVDPVLGDTRQAALSLAEKSLDAGRVVGIFRAFLNTLPPVAQAKSKLEKQVTPSSTASAAPQSTEKPVLTQKQVSEFYKDVALGRYRGRESEQAKFEAVINLAMQENRIS